MNVLIVYPHGNVLNPEEGAEARVYHLARVLSKKNEICILESTRNYTGVDTNKNFVDQLYFFDDYRIKNKKLGVLFLDFNPSFLRNIFTIINSKNIDIIQIAFPWGIIATSLLARFKRFKKSKIIVTYDAHNVHSDLPKISQDDSLFSIKKLFNKYYYFLQEKFSVNIADHIISVSSEDKVRFIEKFSVNPQKITVMPSGTIIPDLSKYDSSKFREKFRLDEDKILILFHGKFTYLPNKEAKELIKNYIAPEIGKIYNNVLFVIAGKGVPIFKEDNIISMGFVDDIYALINSVDLAIVPILKGGGTRLKVLDYMGVGLPIISTKKGIEGINAKNGEHAIIVDDVDEEFIEEFIDAIKYLIDNEQERKRLGANARRLAEEEYDWNKIGEKLDKLYKNLLYESKC